ncbi:hypothetical protein GLOTRDRAFT_125425 [Gloeophyllum trabeum ATCC 11539]|uniref:Uncharacterized protein n=1 Tax=Gloeophyllum trabeum (strain ATCC 11539 / FP-39264 / Madison 617) TaxID=670483 RepID=S7RW74_GLOTA|nr:uncharacterized protein GLOTRDRAFT_125425 [Gloeophyllum trabeum ATCC 11539]EPQ59115.1 hypothetical protein GLOTRDRAFT_125425 [Gloeophyllum trabeum ATCC 11539]
MLHQKHSLDKELAEAGGIANRRHTQVFSLSFSPSPSSYWVRPGYADDAPAASATTLGRKQPQALRGSWTSAYRERWNVHTERHAGRMAQTGTMQE